VEIAAERLSPQVLLVRLSSSLDLLTGGPHNHPERQQTLRGAIEWSYQLLDEHEKTLFRCLATFSGGCDVAAVAAICGQMEDGLRARLYSLRDMSLLRQDGVRQPETSVADEPRFTMLETIREYALERLGESGDGDVYLRHAEYFLQLAERAEPELVGPEQAAWIARLETEHDNLRAALTWLRETGARESSLRLAGALWRFWYMRGYLSEGRAWIENLLASATPTSISAGVRAKALNGAGIMAAEQGDFGRAVELSEESLLVYQEVHDRAGIAGSLTVLGSVLLRQGDYTWATSVFEACLAVRQELGDPRGIAAALNNLGLVAREQSLYLQASTLYEQSLAIKRDLGDRRSIALALNNLGDVAIDRGDYERVAALSEESLALSVTWVRNGASRSFSPIWAM
jgi:tetratricopeptide (TPR) repeat protein